MMKFRNIAKLAFLLSMILYVSYRLYRKDTQIASADKVTTYHVYLQNPTDSFVRIENKDFTIKNLSTSFRSRMLHNAQGKLLFYLYAPEETRLGTVRNIESELKKLNVSMQFVRRSLP
ncbi:MAG: hypothetical protein RQ735_01730 [Flavobacteriaceae bacterium]|nr:hypothetical protein [Flavobacteriaceae bacterium]